MTDHRAAIDNPTCGPWVPEPDDPDSVRRCNRCDSLPHHRCPLGGLAEFLPRPGDDLTRIEEEQLARFIEGQNP